MEGINIWAVLVAALSAFFLGGFWYSPSLFLKAWAREAKQPPQPAGHPAKVFGIAFVFALIAAVAFAYCLGPRPPFERALGFGALTGGCFVAASFGINYQFAARSNLLWLIDGGYHFVQFTLYGVILGL